MRFTYESYTLHERVKTRTSWSSSTEYEWEHQLQIVVRIIFIPGNQRISQFSGVIRQCILEFNSQSAGRIVAKDHTKIIRKHLRNTRWNLSGRSQSNGFVDNKWCECA